MRKLKKGRKLSLKRDQRKALLRSLARNLVLKKKIKTTEARAKEVSGFVEKQITRAKKGTLHSRRILARYLAPDVVGKMISEIAPKYQDRPGGYTRIIKLKQRKGDGAKMAVIELVE